MALVPGSHFRGGDAPGCFGPESPEPPHGHSPLFDHHGDQDPSGGGKEPEPSLGRWAVFWWQTIMTFLFVIVVYSGTLVRPGFGNLAPLAAGLALYAALSTGGCLWVVLVGSRGWLLAAMVWGWRLSNREPCMLV